MAHNVSRSVYRCLIGLHPTAFKVLFGDEMLWIFDEVALREGAVGVLGLFGDVLLSLARQWTVRPALAVDSPLSGSSYTLFSWDRIEYPAASLPVARMIQGGLVSVALVALLSITAASAANVRSFPADACATKSDDPGTRETRSRHLTTARPVAHAYIQVRARIPTRDAIYPAPKSEMWVSYPVLSTGEDFVRSDGSFSPPTANAVVPLASPSTQILTAQYNNARTGANLKESMLTPANVNSNQFGKLFTLKVDGDVYAQPLYLPGVNIPGKGQHNVLYVATENDSVYAFDADGGSPDPLWHATLAKSEAGAKPLSERDTRCFFIGPEIGITSTPVIDPSTGTIYVLARTKESKGMLHAEEYKQRLHALAITTGAEKFGGPVEIKATVKEKSSGRPVDFDPVRENPRAALLLANESVYLTWGSSCDVPPYYGWLISYDAHTLAQQGVFNTAPDKSLSSIWQGDAGPAADSDGNIFVVTGNGEFDAANNGRDYGDSVLKLNPDDGHLKLTDYFTPSNQEQLNARDNDLGSSGPVLLPDQAGAHPHLLITAGKEGKLYLIDRDKMGKFQAGDDPHAVQTVPAANGAFGAVAYWNHHVFFIGSERALQDFSLDHGQLTWKANGPTRFFDSGATPVVSSNAQLSAIVWAASSKNWNEPPGRAAVLYAYDAADVKHQLYTTELNASRDRAGTALRFAMPSVANGKVYLGTRGQVDVYGLLPAH